MKEKWFLTFDEAWAFARNKRGSRRSDEADIVLVERGWMVFYL